MEDVFDTHAIQLGAPAPRTVTLNPAKIGEDRCARFALAGAGDGASPVRVQSLVPGSPVAKAVRSGSLSLARAAVPRIRCTSRDGLRALSLARHLPPNGRGPPSHPHAPPHVSAQGLRTGDYILEVNGESCLQDDATAAQSRITAVDPLRHLHICVLNRDDLVDFVDVESYV